VGEAQKLVKFASNQTKKEEIELLADRIAQRKLTFESYLANKGIKVRKPKQKTSLKK
jgi:hypothetical protein